MNINITSTFWIKNDGGIWREWALTWDYKKEWWYDRKRKIRIEITVKNTLCNWWLSQPNEFI